MNTACAGEISPAKFARNVFIAIFVALKLQAMIETLKFYKDFPKEGINFIDIIPFLQSPAAFREVIQKLAEYTTAANVAAPEARGFLFTAPLLLESPVVKNIVPVRKSGKLPFAEGDLHEVKVVKEYGFDKLYYRESDLAAGPVTNGAIEVTLIDDVLATGGTAEGIAASLLHTPVHKDGHTYPVRIKEFIFLVGIDEIGGAERLEKIAPVKVLMHI